MLKLIQNEYIKVFKKISTLIWIAIVLLITVGLSFVMKIQVDYENSWYSEYSDSDMYTEEMVESQVNAMKDTPSFYQDEADNAFWLTLQENKLYDGEPMQYNLLRILCNNFIENKDEGSTNSTSYKEAVNAIITKDYNTAYSCFAKMYQEPTYTFEGSEDAIKNPYQYKLDHNLIALSEEDVMSRLVDEIVYLQSTLESNFLSNNTENEDYHNTLNSYLITQYRLKNNIVTTINDSTSISSYADDSSSSYWSGIKFSASMTMVVSILMIVIAGGIVAEEFAHGTIKFLLINPVKRSKIIFSKFLTIVSLTIFFMIGYYILNILLGMALYGTSDLGIPLLKVSGGEVVRSSGFGFTASLYGYATISVITYATMAFAISSLFRNSAIAIGASVACLISGNIITQLLYVFRQDWGRYLIFANTDLLSIKNNASLYPHHTMTFAIVTIFVYLFVFLLTAYDGFTRREV